MKEYEEMKNRYVERFPTGAIPPAFAIGKRHQMREATQLMKQAIQEGSPVVVIHEDGVLDGAGYSLENNIPEGFSILQP